MSPPLPPPENFNHTPAVTDVTAVTSVVLFRSEMNALDVLQISDEISM